MVTSNHCSQQNQRDFSVDQANGDVLFDMSAEDADAKSLNSQFVREQARRISHDEAGTLGSWEEGVDHDGIK